jgi:hypothetical protein
MKRQNGVTLNGKLKDVRASQVTVGDPSTCPGQALTGSYVAATLVTDHLAYGGHHQVIFPEEHATDVLAYWALTDGNLEVAIEGWLRSTPATTGGPASAVVVVDRVIYLSVTDTLRDQVARYKAAARSGASKPAARK